MTTNAAAAALPPGIAPPIALHPQQDLARQRLHEAAACLPRSSRIVVAAGDVQDLLNAFLQETRRADQATARLESLLEHHQPDAAN
jgi:hypothetical protein